MNRDIYDPDAPDTGAVNILDNNIATLNAIFEASLDALIISDIKGIIVMANRQVEGLFGYDANELVGKSIASLMPERFRSTRPGQCEDHTSLSFAQLAGLHGNIKVLRKDGRESDVEISLSRIDTIQGMFIVSSIRDISDHQLFEKSLREYEEKLFRLFELSPLGIVMSDLNGDILDFNESYRNIFGYSREQLLKIDHKKLSPKRYVSEDTRKLGELYSTGRYQPYEKEYLHENGSMIPVRISGALLTGAEGDVYVCSVVEDITLQKQTEDRIRSLAYFDQLTGLPNRTLMKDRLKQVLASSGRNGIFGGALLINLDNFKEINDILGHEAGDMLLKEASEKLKKCVHEGDTVSRLGGDEFLIILDNLCSHESEAAASVLLTAEKIIATLKQSVTHDQEIYQCSASVGATLFGANLIETGAVLKQLDLALNLAKAAGRGTIRFYDSEVEAAVNYRRALERDLRRALEEKEFLLYYQAQIMDNGTITGAEVLVRWHHPKRGIISPIEFIPLAEETGLILPLGKWVLEAACAQLAIWSTLPELAHLSLAVNVSVRQFGQPDFVRQVLTTLRTFGANPHRLKLELTESVLANDTMEIGQKMIALKMDGVTFSLDDFGTGYSSLFYLKRLPLDQLKIDRSFVHDVLTNQNDAAIVRTVIALAENLGFGVIAEGVETKAQQEFLANAGCKYYQGYLFSEPVPLDRFEQLIRSRPRVPQA